MAAKGHVASCVLKCCGSELSGHAGASLACCTTLHLMRSSCRRHLQAALSSLRMTCSDTLRMPRCSKTACCNILCRKSTSRCAEGLIAYVEWAPLPRVRASGLIAACAFLLSVPDHRMAAATVLRQLSARKQLQASSRISRCCPTRLQQGPPHPLHKQVLV